MEKVKYVTVSAKIPLELRAKMRKYGIKPSVVFKEAIEEAITMKGFAKLKKQLKIAQKLAMKITTEDIVRDIREDRDGR